MLIIIILIQCLNNFFSFPPFNVCKSLQTSGSLIFSTFTYLLNQITYLFNVTNLATTVAATSALPTFTLHFFRCQACCWQRLHGTDSTGDGKAGRERKMSSTNILIMNQYF